MTPAAASVMDALATAVTHKAYELGFNMVGFVPAQPARRLDAYLHWIAQEMHGRMAYMARPDRITRRQDLNVILPGVQTIICVGLDYSTSALPETVASDPSRGRISNYAWGTDYHEVMTPRLEELADWLAGQVRDMSTSAGIHSRVYVDTGAILERDHAETAGLGFTGKNTMLIHPRRGSFFFLGEILTTLPLHHSPFTIHNSQLPIDHYPLTITHPPMPTCGTCRRCLDACPTNAFPQPYVLDARRCISYLTIELKEWIPVALRPYMGNWIYGCDICQEVCPFNRFAQPTEEPAFAAANWDAAAPPLLDLLALTEEDFAQRFAHSPIRRLKRTRFLRNVCVAVGNWGSATAVPALIALLSDPHPLVRGHAAWALHQIGTPEGLAAMAAALDTETDTVVQQELTGHSLSFEE